MKTKIKWARASLGAMALSAICWTQASNAALLGDTYNPTQPLLNFNNDGTTTYTAASDAFSIDATTLSIIQGGFNVVVNGDFKIDVVVDNLGDLTGGVPGDDLVVAGNVTLGGTPYSGVLLTGEVSAFGFEDQTTFIDGYDFRFAVTGGALAGLFGTQVGVKVASEQSNFDGSFDSDFAGEAKGNLGPLAEPCELSVEKTCAVLTPVSDNYECDKPIDELTMVWNGLANNVTIKAYKGDTNDELLEVISGVNMGEEVTVTGYAGSPNDVFWEIFDASGNKLGESNFHLSCSDDAMDGAEDCGLPQGDGKDDDSGLLNDWLLEGIVDAGGVLNCTADEPLPGNKTCQVPSQDGELCTKRPTAISFRYYAGDNCRASDNTQDSDKWSCSDSGLTGDPVQIIVSKDDGNNVSLDTGPGATVNSGDVVTATAANAGRSDFDSASRIQILNGSGGLLQDIELHTSCSQDLRIGDRFGAIEVVGFVNEDQGSVQSGAEVKYSYLVKNTGGVDLTGITVVDDGLDPTTVPGSPIDLVAGQITDPALMATVFVSDPITSTVTVTAVTPAGQCSAQSSTTVTVAEPPPCVITTGEFKLEDDKIKWKLTNDGDKVATVESIEFSAPDEFGEVKKVKLDGDIFKDSTRPMTWTFTDADFVNDLKNRQIKVGDTKELTFETTQKFKTATADQVSITVNFKEGCSVTFVPGQQAFVCSDAKPIDSLSMIWNGPGLIDVEVDGQIQTDIANGQEVTFSGLSGLGNSVEWTISGAENGVSAFHVSCSDAAMNGPDDCGSLQGNDKGNDSDLINMWLFEGMEGSNGIGFDCSALP